jgi:hypothetical protein
MKKIITLLSAACFVSAGAFAASDPADKPATPAPKTVKKAVPRHKPGKHVKNPKSASQEKPAELLDDDDKVYQAGTDAAVELNCELGNKLTLYRNASDRDHMALRWNQRVHRMTRVSTTTGADRFENSKYNLVWIGIPAKGMLLDSKKGRQLANECRDAEQMKPVVQTRPADLPAPIEAPRVVPKS